MPNKAKINAWTIGLAMFAMFFGAGNIIFPITLGQYAGSQNASAICGLFITAVIVPFVGLASMLTFNGNYNACFGRIWKVPGSIIAILIMAIICPLLQYLDA